MVIGTGASFFILSNNNKGKTYIDDDGNEESLMFISTFPKSILYGYDLSVGQFNLDSFNSSTNPYLLWIHFIFATLTTMIVLLNMLVAIMTDSFN